MCSLVLKAILGLILGDCMSVLRLRRSTLDGFGFIFEFRRLYERPLEVHVVALEINFGAVEHYFRRSVGTSWGFDLNF